MKTPRLLPLAACLAWLIPSVAAAKDIAISPMVAANGTDEKVVNNVTAILSSELEFMSEFDWAEQLGEMPAGMNAACLAKNSCLKTVGKAAGRDMLLAGKVTPAGGDSYEILLVLFDVAAGTKAGESTFTVQQATMPDQLGPALRLLVGGDAALAEAEDAGPSADDFGMFDDEDDSMLPTVSTPGNSRNSLDDFEASDPEDDRRAAEAEARRRADEDAKRRAEDDARRRAEEDARRRAEDDARRRAEEDARRRAEEDARRRAEDEARRRADEDAQRRAEESRLADEGGDDDDFDIDDLNFSTAVGSSDEPEEDSYSRYDDERPSSSSSTRSSSPSSDSRSSRYSDLDDLEAEESRDSRSASSSSRYSDLDADEPDERRERDSRGTTSSSTSSDKAQMGVAFRAGGSKMQSLNFVTYGVELSIPVAARALLAIGLEGYSTKRDVPPALQEEFGPVIWNTITPLSFGVTFQNQEKAVRPYVGGDLTLTPYTSNFKTAPGLRLRGGSDFMVSDGFGFNVNATVGAWYGSEFNLVQADLEPLALVPQLSVGTIIRF